LVLLIQGSKTVVIGCALMPFWQY